MLVELREALSNLLGCGHAKITKDGAVQGSRIVEVDNLAHKICAVARQQLIHAKIRIRVKATNQLVILLRRRFNLKRETGAVIRRSNQLDPWAFRCLAIRSVGNEA